MIVILKVLGLAGVTAVIALWESGDCLYSIVVLPGLIVMWLATRQRVRRRARDGIRE